MAKHDLTPEQLVHYEVNGWLLLDGLLEKSPQELQNIVSTVASWGDDGAWLNHYEMTDFGKKLARTENFTPYSSDMRSLLREGAISDVASQLLGEEALLYKEKINYKLVGGAGFAPHHLIKMSEDVSRHTSSKSWTGSPWNFEQAQRYSFMRSHRIAADPITQSAIVERSIPPTTVSAKVTFARLTTPPRVRHFPQYRPTTESACHSLVTLKVVPYESAGQR